MMVMQWFLRSPILCIPCEFKVKSLCLSDHLRHLLCKLTNFANVILTLLDSDPRTRYKKYEEGVTWVRREGVYGKVECLSVSQFV